MFLTNNYIILTRSYNTTGTFVHKSESDEFLHLRFNRCKNMDYENVAVKDVTDNEVRINVGKNSASLLLKLEGKDQVEINNLPVAATEEVWVATTCPHIYCVYGYVTKQPIQKY
tara:strand:+ start:106 stop:447 length:342 start_codon:yes stop_codon:yes gene_type:complete